MNCGFLMTILTLFMPEYLRFRSTYYGHFQNGRYLVNFCLKRTIKMIGLRWGAYMLELFFTKSYACILRFFYRVYMQFIHLFCFISAYQTEISWSSAL